MTYYYFQQSKLWEAGDPVDPNLPPMRIKAKSSNKARKQLPKPDLGRTWILLREET